MTEPLTLRYRVDPALAVRAMTAWQEPFDLLRKRRFPLRFLLPLMAAGLLIGLAANMGLLALAGIAAVNGALFGFMLGMVFWFVMHQRNLRALYRFATEGSARDGETRLRLDQTGLTIATDAGETRIPWQGLDDVIAMRGATALRLGTVMHPIPDTALPATLPPGRFRDTLHAWRDGAR